jgi:hypothetical protein
MNLTVKAFLKSDIPIYQTKDVYFYEENHDFIVYDDDDRSVLMLDLGTSFDVLQAMLNCQDFSNGIKTALSQNYSVSNTESIKVQLDALLSFDYDNAKALIDEKEIKPYRYRVWKDERLELKVIVSDLICLYKEALEKNLVVGFCF